MIIYGYEISLWRILFISLTLCIAAWHYFVPFQIEGFQTDAKGFDKVLACPALQNTLDKHKQLLEDYIKRDAVSSVEHTKGAIALFTKAYKENECETYINTMPAKEAKKEGE
jgi:hypothetical protein